MAGGGRTRWRFNRFGTRAACLQKGFVPFLLPWSFASLCSASRSAPAARPVQPPRTATWWSSCGTACAPISSPPRPRRICLNWPVSGVFFANHHPVYLSATEVNGTAIATGAYPSHSGLIANTDFRPAIDPAEPVDTGKPSIIRRGDEVSGDHFIALPTLAEILHAHGLATVIAGSKWIALLHDRGRRPDGPESSLRAVPG
jgi:hypothetical protein